MSLRNDPRRVLFYEAAGFVAILALTWTSAFLQVPEPFFQKHTARPELWEAAIESAGVLAIGATILRTTWRIQSRLFYLESFLRVCAWCRKIERNGRWIEFEEYLASGFATRTTHGMCPECAAKERNSSAG
jgi:hypothetical protein